ncbi:DUF7657 domain-containing protein [Comamonas flocculans]|uniref:Uncharacterized protein n=1 Tax=Comamonas flocculans TaxID=2597701 RepID=A0A5B8RUE6_9BURK|nr:hypothetical protein [Comamonas flocculans]QEA13239.1 hypothetical protein FOZ74_09475 [Comamonas flocculans]
MDWDPVQRTLAVVGWAGTAQPQAFITSLRVLLDGQSIYHGPRWQHEERDDVVRATGRPDWRGSGYRIIAPVPASLACSDCTVRVIARTGDGHAIELAAGPSLKGPSIAPAALRGWHAWLLLALLALPLVTLACRRCSPLALAGATAVAFVALVASGTTGSSLPLLLQGAAVVQGDAPVWLGQARPIRSDEWEVITPMALAQQAHEPRFPVVNHNLGAGGQNMLVIGMTGVPVAHVSALARPATWGFFMLPLPQALAWYGWLPFFACFAALWWLIGRIASIGWRPAAALAAALSWSAYAMAFSGWPAYLLFFGVAGLSCAMHALRTERMWAGALSGAGLGLAVAGYVLVLYPAWQVSLGYLLAAVAVGWAWQARGTLRRGGAQALALLMAVLIAVGLLGAWWHDAAATVHAIEATVYPGQRAANVGGDIDPWYLIKGLLSVSTMYQTPPLMDASDAGSNLWLFIPLAVLLAWRLITRRAVGALGLAVALYLLAAFIYMVFGIPEPLARASLWGRVLTYRMDLALGLAQVLLLAILWERAAPPPRPVAAAALMLALVAALWSWRQLPVPLAGALSPAAVALSTLVWALLAWWLTRGEFARATALFTVWTLAIALPFQPLVGAPQALTLAPALAAHLPPGSRVAVLGDRRWSLLLPATGTAVVNAVHYAPPAMLWRRLDPDDRQQAVHNRYQRLLLRLQTLTPDAPPYEMTSPRLDEVVLTLDPARFDFRLLQASHVLAAPQDTPALQANPALREETRGAQWVLWALH